MLNRIGLPKNFFTDLPGCGKATGLNNITPEESPPSLKFPVAAMNQLSLGLTPRLPYGADNFSLHSGVASILQASLAGAQADRFYLASVLGAPRSGKTHLSIALADGGARAGLHPHFVEGSRGLDQLLATLGGRVLSREDLLIFDDAERVFEDSREQGSGRFVALVESLRLARGTIVLLSARPAEEFGCDDHILSRIRAGESFQIGNPTDGELGKLVTMMAHQRGLELTPSRVAYLTRRVGRSIPAIDSYFDRLAQLARTLGRSIGATLLADAAVEEL